MFQEFVSSEGYNYSYNLQEGNATLMWSVEDGTVKGRLAYNGLFGWVAFGFANVGGEKNGMHGASIIMALPGGNYSAYSGLDLNMTPTVAEYVIHPKESSFRFWSTPVTDGDDIAVAQRSTGSDMYDVESTECFTALTFQTPAINSKAFNLTGSDELLWAANGNDFYVGYHGMHRGRFSIDWPSGEVHIHNHSHEEGGDSGHNETGTSSAAITLSMTWTMWVAAMVSVAAL
jgi:hypothetical protein